MEARSVHVQPPRDAAQRDAAQRDAAQRDAAQRVARRYLLAMSNLVPKRTGVKGVVIWVSAGEFAGKDGQHGPRVKVVLGSKITTESLDDAVSVRLSDPPEVLGTLPGKVAQQVLKFVTLNRKTLLGYWALKLDTATMIERLVPIGPVRKR
jgi:hypothetical protein